jgi:accessory gene regulator protein AgrB
MWVRVYSVGALRQVSCVCGLINVFLCVLIRHLSLSGGIVVAL